MASRWSSQSRIELDQLHLVQCLAPVFFMEMYTGNTAGLGGVGYFCTDWTEPLVLLFSDWWAVERRFPINLLPDNRIRLLAIRSYVILIIALIIARHYGDRAVNTPLQWVRPCRGAWAVKQQTQLLISRCATCATMLNVHTSVLKSCCIYTFSPFMTVGQILWFDLARDLSEKPTGFSLFLVRVQDLISPA